MAMAEVEFLRSTPKARGYSRNIPSTETRRVGTILNFHSYSQWFSRKILWGSGIVKDPPTMAYEEVMSQEVAVLKWLEKIVRQR